MHPHELRKLQREIDWLRIMVFALNALVFAYLTAATTLPSSRTVLACMGILTLLLAAVPAVARRYTAPCLVIEKDEQVLLRVAAELRNSASFHYFDLGFLYVTTKRVAFLSRRRRVTMPLESEIDVTARRLPLRSSRLLRVASRGTSCDFGVYHPELLKAFIREAAISSRGERT